MGGMTSSTSTSTPKMPGYVKDIYKDVYKDVGRAYNKFGKNGMPVFSEPTTAGLTGQQTGALTGMQNTATANSGANGMGGRLQDIMSNGGFTGEQQASMSSLRNLTNNGFLNSLINGNGLTDDQKSVADFYRTGMNEQFGTDANYNRVKQNALDASAQGVTGMAAKMGRFGGGANQNILARAQGDLAASMDTNELDKYRARTVASAGNLANLSGTGVSQHGGAVDRKANLESTLFNMQQAGLGNMGQAYDASMKPYQTQMGVGNILQQQNQNVINDKMRIFDAQNPMNAYQQFLGLASGMPTGQVQTTTPSTLQMLLGGGLGTMGLLGGLGMFGGGSAPAGSAGGV
jgi:hypothetical protein